jgi:hypothetical protein
MADSTSKPLQGGTGPWEVVMRLGLHAEAASKAKLFAVVE